MEDFWVQLERKLNDRNRKCEFGNQICQRIMNLELNEEICVGLYDWQDIWQYQYNPEKGETPNGEMNRWLEFVSYNYGIVHAPDYYKNLYYFKKLRSGAIR